MPGTIHVSVLDFSDLPSTSSPIHFKVSMGRREYHSLDKGDFFFPVKSLREKLTVTVLDDGGSKLSQTAVEASLVVQKSIRDNYFSLEGGGQVHMRLQFELSDEDRSKIRMMRESAMQKKRLLLLSSHSEYVKSSRIGVGADKCEVSVDISSTASSRSWPEGIEARKGNIGHEAAKATLLSESISFSDNDPCRNLAINERDSLNKELTFSNDTDRPQETVSNTLVPNLLALCPAQINAMGLQEKVEACEVSDSPEVLNSKHTMSMGKGKIFFPKLDDMAEESKKKVQLRKTPSSVGKMISAFEGNTTQETKPRIKSSPLTSQLTKIQLENPLKDISADAIETNARVKLTEISSDIVVRPSFIAELRQKVTAKRRQLSATVVEIVTTSSRKDVAEDPEELAAEPSQDETSVPSTNTKNTFVVTVEGMRSKNIHSHDYETRADITETKDNMDSANKELDIKGTGSIEDQVKIQTLANNKFEQTHDKSDGKDQNCQQSMMRPPTEETENNADVVHNLVESKDTKDSDYDVKVSDVETASVSGKYLQNYPIKQQAANVPNDHQDSGVISHTTNSDKKLHSEEPLLLVVGKDSSVGLESTKFSMDWPPIGEPGSPWVFPDEPRFLCMTASDTEKIKFAGGSSAEAKVHAIVQTSRCAIESCDAGNRSKDLIDGQSRPGGSKNSAGSDKPNGQFAQVIKIAIMVAFGALVFFTRQRNTR